ncbi:uncharacterized protein YALI1_C07117g [Yarrowia lipolytica]|uniref:Golgi apparatus membrane protein TVP15 n=1 Tax=Yarrowia lipolytica TaxID=4952 RepID=A0A1D8N9T3_YARLL|nr:hypothetical protein YALI1_C07117g [Yarrowia lipolytica]
MTVAHSDVLRSWPPRHGYCPSSIVVVPTFGNPVPLLTQILLSFYLIIFGYSIASLEFATPPVAHKYGSFLFSFVGRGILYILIAAILMSGGFFRYLISFIIFGIGALFVVLEFIPSIEPPENMRNEPLDYMEEV